MKPDKVSPLAKEDKEKDEKSQSTLSAVLSERRFSEVSSLASLQSGICRSDDFWLQQELKKSQTLSVRSQLISRSSQFSN